MCCATWCAGVSGSRVLRSSEHDDVAVVATGITVHEALEASRRLGEEELAVRVIDLYSVKPIDVETLRQAASDTGGRLITVEDHRAEGGIGDAVLDVFAEATSGHDQARRARVASLREPGGAAQRRSNRCRRDRRSRTFAGGSGGERRGAGTRTVSCTIRSAQG